MKTLFKKIHLTIKKLGEDIEEGECLLDSYQNMYHQDMDYPDRTILMKDFKVTIRAKYIKGIFIKQRLLLQCAKLPILYTAENIFISTTKGERHYLRKKINELLQRESDENFEKNRELLINLK